MTNIPPGTHIDRQANRRILIYQPGKVGSVAVKHSLEILNPGLPIEDAHILSPSSLTTSVQWHASLGVRELPPYIESGRRLLAAIRAAPDIDWKVITIFREPIARMISGFFEDASRLFPDSFPARGNWDYAVVDAHLRHDFMGFDPALDYTCRWFDNEIRVVLDVDVYDSPFPHDFGYCRRTKGNVDLLVLRYETLGDVFGPAMQTFFELDAPPRLVHANETRDKPYAAIYRRVLEEFSLPLSIGRAIYSTRFAQHFYTPQERQRLLARWCDEPESRAKRAFPDR